MVIFMVRYVYLFEDNEGKIFFDKEKKQCLLILEKTIHNKANITSIFLLGGCSSILYCLSKITHINSYLISIICFICSAVIGGLCSIRMNKKINQKMTNAAYIHLSDKEIKLHAEDIRRAVNSSETSLFFFVVGIMGIVYSYFYNNLISVLCTSVVLSWCFYVLPFHNLRYIKLMEKYVNKLELEKYNE